MRDIRAWKRNLLRQLALECSPREAEILCQVELGLCALSHLAPGEGAEALPALLSGYLFALHPEGTPNWSAEQKRVWSSARVLLPFRLQAQWERALRDYNALPECLRGYELGPDGRFTQREVSVCAGRHNHFRDTLRKPVPHRARPVRWAEEGEYEFLWRGHFNSVRIPPEFVLAPPQGHSFAARKKRDPIHLRWEDLKATALWMDEEEERRQVLEADWGRWKKRFDRLQLELLDNSGHEGPSLVAGEALSVDGLAHVIGMVSSGKSTLMDVAAVWAARNGRHVTLVVGDVVGALNRAQMFARLGLEVAPILGASNRKRHIERLHRTLAGTETSPNPGSQFNHAGFRWLSTACPLDGLRAENNLHSARHPLQVGKLPCLSLAPRREQEEGDEGDEEPQRSRAWQEEEACPLYSRCPFHQAQRDLVQAPIWIATPASLVYTGVAPQLNDERVRFMEMVYRRSDLVIVDEADQVQVQLDAIFNPSQTLVGRDGWLSWLHERVPEQLNLQRRAPLAQEDVGVWLQGHDTAQAVTNRIYNLIQQQEDLRHWVEQNNYFTDLTLFDQLAQVLGGEAGAGVLREQFESYIANPLGEEGDSALGALAQSILVNTLGAQNRVRLLGWIEENVSPQVEVSRDEMNRQAARLELALLVAVLQNRVHHLLRHWSAAEGPLKLEGGASLLAHLAPEDYRSLLPEPPMGQVLAFQYVGGDAKAPGDLRFFRCMGVGRWMLLHLHELFEGDGVAGPNVLLLSGTSWAGTSPSYHLQAPVNAVLRAPDEEVQAIESSLFEFFPQRDAGHRPIRVSGKQGQERAHALRSLLHQLSQFGGLGGPGLLEQERDKLAPERRRVLLLVGSYEEARAAYKYLSEHGRPDWRGQMRYLVPDDASFEGEWRGGAESQGEGEGHLRRGLVGELAQTPAWLLIAPLLAVERGHNILTAGGDKAAIGAAFFLVRPHPRPDDINFAVHSINHWAIERHGDHLWLQQMAARAAGGDTSGPLTWAGVGEAFRAEAEERWRELLRLRMQMSTLPDAEREAVLWSQLVSIWQVIGRLVRGGSPARVFFCDAAFAPASAALEERADQSSSSLLIGMREVLRPYFEPQDTPPTARRAQDCALVQTLYGPFYAALRNIRGLPTGIGADDVEDETDDRTL